MADVFVTSIPSTAVVSDLNVPTDVFVTSLPSTVVVSDLKVPTEYDLTSIASTAFVSGLPRFVDVTGIALTALVADPDSRKSRHYDLAPVQPTSVVNGIFEWQNQISTYSIKLYPFVSNVDWTKTYLFAGDLAGFAVSGFASFKVDDMAPGAGFISSLGRRRSPALAFAEAEAIHVRAMPNTVVQMDAPAIYHGVPRIPLIHSTSDASVSAAGAVDDTDDDIDDQSGFLHRFKVGTLADASSGEYWLESWKDTDDDWEWKSAYPYRPWVQKRTERLKDHTDRVYTRSLHFNNRYVEHMWLNMGAEYPELTVIVAGMFHGFRGLKHGHYLLDAGKATPIYEDVVDGEKHKIDDKLDYRATMLYRKQAAFFGTADAKDIRNKKHIKVKHDDRRKPKVLFAVFNGENSMAGSWDIDDFDVKYGSLNPKPIKRLVLGRARNKVNRKFASDMTLFEIMIFTKALNKKQIKKRCKRLAGRYKFQRYWD